MQCEQHCIHVIFELIGCGDEFPSVWCLIFDPTSLTGARGTHMILTTFRSRALLSVKNTRDVHAPSTAYGARLKMRPHMPMECNSFMLFSSDDIFIIRWCVWDKGVVPRSKILTNMPSKEAPRIILTTSLALSLPKIASWNQNEPPRTQKLPPKPSLPHLSLFYSPAAADQSDTPSWTTAELSGTYN